MRRQGAIRFSSPRLAKRIDVSAAVTALALVAGVATVALLNNGLRADDPRAQLSVPVPSSPPITQGSSTQSASNPVPLQSAAATAPQLAGPQNLRMVVHEARAQRQSGGLLRAHGVLMECRYAKPPAPYDGKSGARRLAVAKLAAKAEACSSFTADELRDAGFAAHQGDPQADRAVQVSDRLQPGTSEADRRLLASQILKDPDGGQLLVVPRLMAKDGDDRDHPTYYLDQKPFGGVDPKLYLIALDLLPCAFGEDCGPDGSTVSEQCASNGFCAANAFEMRRASIGRPGQYEAMMSVFNRLKTALNDGDLAALTPPLR